MIANILRWLFVPSRWTIIDRQDVYGKTFEEKRGVVYQVYILQDQFGNIKSKKV